MSHYPLLAALAGTDLKVAKLPRLLFAAAVATTLIMVSVSPAKAGQAFCGDRTKIVTQLEKRHSEGPRALGLNGNGSMVEVFTTVNGSSWTILVTQPDGRSCVVAAGQYWNEIAAKPVGDVS